MFISAFKALRNILKTQVQYSDVSASKNSNVHLFLFVRNELDLNKRSPRINAALE